MNLVGEATPKTSWKVRNSLSPASLTISAERPPSSPPNRPCRASLQRSNSALKVISGAMIRKVRSVPRPPRCRPAPPESLAQPVAQGQQRIAMLEHLDRRVAAVGVPGHLAVIAVLVRRGAGTHAVEMVVAVVAAGLRMDAAEQQVAARAAGGGGDAVGHGLGECREQQVDQLRLQIGVAADRGTGMPDVHDRPGRGDDLQRAIAAGIARDLVQRIGDAEDGVVEAPRRPRRRCSSSVPAPAGWSR